MHVFIDDSETFAKNGFLCLAGLIASDSEWNTFYERWAELLRTHELEAMHTSDFLAGQGEYRDLGLDYATRLDVLNDFMDVIREQTQCGIFCSINAGEYKEALAHARKKLQPEEFIFRRILKRSFDYMVSVDSMEAIQFWLDDNTKTSSRFLSIWGDTKNKWKFAKTMLGSISFGDDRGILPLQAADVLANVLVRSHGTGINPWHAKSPFSRLFIHPRTQAVATHIRGEVWTAADVGRLSGAIVELAKLG